MPSKQKRVAARQTQMSQRKHKDARRPPATQLEHTIAREPEAAEVSEERPTGALSPAPAATNVSVPVPQLQRLSPYVMKELRRVGILSGLMLAILVALTFVLRG